MNKLIYICGMMMFIASFFVPTLPNQMTSAEGREVKMWITPGLTHVKLAVEPIVRLVECLTYKQDPSAHGDGLEEYCMDRLQRAIFALPASLAWFSIVSSVLITPWAWTLSGTKPSARLGLRIIGGIMLAAVPFLIVDFCKQATLYKGYFHLGLGGYLIVGANLLIGLSFVSQFEVRHRAEPHCDGDGSTRTIN